MPNRIVRDGILRSRRINALSAGAELFYRRLMSVVDDHGRYESDITLLISSCYPLTFDRTSPSDVSTWLSELCGSEFNPLVTQYEVNGKKYLQINDFGQRIRSESKCPNPPCLTNDGQMTASRARSNTHTTTHTAVTFDFDGKEPIDWFQSVFVGEFPSETWRQFGMSVNTPELAAKLKANTPLWMRTKKYSGGFGKDAIAFLRSGIWHNPPAPQMLDSAAPVEPEERLPGVHYNEYGHPMRMMR